MGGVFRSAISALADPMQAVNSAPSSALHFNWKCCNPAADCIYFNICGMHAVCSKWVLQHRLCNCIVLYWTMTCEMNSDCTMESNETRDHVKDAFSSTLLTRIQASRNYLNFRHGYLFTPCASQHLSSPRLSQPWQLDCTQKRWKHLLAWISNTNDIKC